MAKKNRPFNIEPYLPLPYGHGGLHTTQVSAKIVYKVIGEESKEILLTYRVVQPPIESTTYNMEDIYSANTPRFMVTKCLSGHIFPFISE